MRGAASAEGGGGGAAAAAAAGGAALPPGASLFRSARRRCRRFPARPGLVVLAKDRQGLKVMRQGLARVGADGGLAEQHVHLEPMPAPRGRRAAGPGGPAAPLLRAAGRAPPLRARACAAADRGPSSAAACVQFAGV
jgi:hypothetical protein